jgi:uncharacterized protein YndB with AHSA1/START domain
MTTNDRTPPTTQVYEIYIKASPQKIWDAITTPEWTARYGYQGPVEYELRKGGKFRANPSVAMVQMGMTNTLVDGEVLEADPPHKLVQTYRFLFSDEMREEGYSRLTYEIEATKSGFTRLTVTHECEGQPTMAAMVATRFDEMGTGGWAWILSDLKSVLETGAKMAG